jgi:hypothetical protein
MNRFKLNLSLIVLILGIYTEGSSQTYGLQILNGTKMQIQSGTTFSLDNNLGAKIDGTNSRITNNGSMVVAGSFLNQNGGVVQNGSYKIGGNFTSLGSIFSFINTSTVEFYSNNPTTISTTSSFNNLTISKEAANPIVNLASAITVNSVLNFGLNDCYIQTNAFNLRLLSTGSITGFDDNNFIITNGTAALDQEVGSTLKTYPIGTAIGAYTPLKIQQSGSFARLSARVSNTVSSNPNISGSPALTSGVVDKTWEVLELATPVIKNLSITAQWNGVHELADFDPAKCGLSRWNSTGSNWDMVYSQVGVRSGLNPYTRLKNGISEVGTFAVGSKPVSKYVHLSAKVFLQGAYTTGGIMSEGLRSANLIPSAENTVAPSGQMPRPNAYVHTAWGGNETAASGAFAVQPMTNDNIVDWVFVELRSPSASSTVLHTRAALLQRDGDIVNEDGTSPLRIYGVADGSYYISIKHRNHVAVRTATTKNLSFEGISIVDFTTNLSQSLATSGVPYNALATLPDGKYGLWGGNVNSDVSTRRSGSATTSDYSLFLNYLGAASLISTVYRREDFNLDGTVRRTGSATTSDYSRFLGFLGANAIITQPTF